MKRQYMCDAKTGEANYQNEKLIFVVSYLLTECSTEQNLPYIYTLQDKYV